MNTPTDSFIKFIQGNPDQLKGDALLYSFFEGTRNKNPPPEDHEVYKQNVTLGCYISPNKERIEYLTKQGPTVFWPEGEGINRFSVAEEIADTVPLYGVLLPPTRRLVIPEPIGKDVIECGTYISLERALESIKQTSKLYTIWYSEQSHERAQQEQNTAEEKEETYITMNPAERESYLSSRFIIPMAYAFETGDRKEFQKFFAQLKGFTEGSELEKYVSTFLENVYSKPQSEQIKTFQNECMVLYCIAKGRHDELSDYL